MTKIFIPSDQFQVNRGIIKDEDARHLVLVLRKKPGDKILLGVNNKTYKAEIQAIADRQVEVAVLSQIETIYESPIYTRLYQGLAKGNKFELVIEKAVELGVNEIIPFTSRHTVVKLTEDKKQSRQQRWQKIANTAAKQCKRDVLPQVATPTTFDQVVEELSQSRPEHLRLMAYELARENGLKSFAEAKPEEVSIIVGPEGGFSQAEVNKFIATGGKIVTLGNRILRTETAGMTCLAMIQLLWGDLG